MTFDDGATVIYNAKSGNGDDEALEDIERCLRDQGIEPTVHRTESAGELDEILPGASGLVVACGGDGTLSAVFERVAGRDDVQIAPVPMGTANNLGHALGVSSDPMEALADLGSRTPQRMDLGTASQGPNDARFVEGFGCGVYAELLHRYDPDQGKSVVRAFKTLVEVLPSFEPASVTASVDGADVSGDYLIFAVLNTKRIGPQIELAPDADPCDGQFEVVGVRPDGRGSLRSYVEARIAGEVGAFDDVVLRRGRELEIAPAGLTFHLDTHTFETTDGPEASDASIRISVDEGAVAVLLPGPCG